MKQGDSRQELLGSRENVMSNASTSLLAQTAEGALTNIEKRFLLLAERGDVASVNR